MRKKSMRVFSLMLCTAMIVSTMLTGCGGGSNTTGASSGTSAETGTTAKLAEELRSEDDQKNLVATDETLTFMVNAEPSVIFGGDLNEGGIIVLDAIGASILEYNSTTHGWNPGICDSFETEDDTHYVFHLREGAVFSDGTPITVEDIIFSLQVWQGSGASGTQYFDMENTEKIDDSHFRFVLTEYVPGWEGFLSTHTGTVVSQASFEAAGGLDNVAREGCLMAGKYTLGEWVPGSSITLVRNDNYFDTDWVGYYKYIKLVFVSDAASRLLSVRSGDADGCNRVSTADVVSLQSDSTINAISTLDGIYNVYFNNGSGACADVRIREALSYAIDGNAVNASLCMGTGELSNGLILPDFPYYEERDVLQCDREKAIALLEELGYSENNKLSLYLPTIQSNASLATIIQEQLRLVNVEVQVEILEQSAFLEKSRGGDFDMIVGNSGIFYVNTNNFNQVDPKLAGVTVQNCRITEDADLVNEMINRCINSDTTVAAQGWADLQSYIFDNYVLRGTCTNHTYAAMRADLTGLDVGNTMGYPDLTNIHPVG